MKKRWILWIVVGLMGIMAGCASLSKNECLQADWYEIGYADGCSGQPRAFFQEHIDACRRHGVQADQKAYHAGRAQGLKRYCTWENGIEQGKHNRPYRHACPPMLELEFMAGYYKGLEIYQYNVKVAKLKRQLTAIEGQIKAKEDELVTENLSGAQRSQLRADLRALDLEYRNTTRALRSLRNSNTPE